MSAGVMRSAAARAMPGSISRREANTCRASSGDGLATKAPRLRSVLHQAFEGQHLQGRAGHGAADVEQRADLAFREFGARRQAAVDDGVAQMVADRLGAIFAGAVGCGKLWSADVHGDTCSSLFIRDQLAFAQDANVHTIAEKIAYDFCADREQSPIICAVHNDCSFQTGSSRCLIIQRFKCLSPIRRIGTA